MNKNFALVSRIILFLAAVLFLGCSHQGVADMRAESDAYQHATLYADGGLREVFNTVLERWRVRPEVFGIYHEYGANVGFIDPNRGVVWLASMRADNTNSVQIQVYEHKSMNNVFTADLRNLVDAGENP